MQLLVELYAAYAKSRSTQYRVEVLIQSRSTQYRVEVLIQSMSTSTE